MFNFITYSKSAATHSFIKRQCPKVSMKVHCRNVRNFMSGNEHTLLQASMLVHVEMVIIS